MKLDISGYERYTLHRYSLGHFNIVEEMAGADDVARFALGADGARMFLRQARGLLAGRRVKRSVMERHPHFDPAVLELGDHEYLDGYWQCEKYFADAADIIRREFTVKQAPDGENAELGLEMEGVSSVAVHVRRADYASDPMTNRVHGTLSSDYYREAMELVSSRVKDARFYVFSDEEGWARENLPSDRPITFVSHNGPDKNYEDLRLMTRCRCNILANSTFSWWGAWLGDRPGKIVVAPKAWFRVGDLNRDLIPKRWVRK